MFFFLYQRENIFFRLLPIPFFKKHKINEKESAKKCGLHFNIKIQWKTHVKRIRISPHFSNKTAIFFADFPNIVLKVCCKNFKVLVVSTTRSIQNAGWPSDFQYKFVIW